MLFYFAFVVPSEYASSLFLIPAREVSSYFRRPCETSPSRVCSYQFLSLARLHFVLFKCDLNFFFSLRIKVLLKIIQQVERLIKMLSIRYTHSFGKVGMEDA